MFYESTACQHKNCASYLNDYKNCSIFFYKNNEVKLVLKSVNSLWGGRSIVITESIFYLPIYVINHGPCHPWLHKISFNLSKSVEH